LDKESLQVIDFSQYFPAEFLWSSLSLERNWIRGTAWLNDGTIVKQQNSHLSFQSVPTWRLFQVIFMCSTCCRLLRCLFAGNQDPRRALDAIWHQSLSPPSLLIALGVCVHAQAATGKESPIDVMAALRHMKDNFKGHWSFSSYWKESEVVLWQKCFWNPGGSGFSFPTSHCS
jgi:hypothetical protein